MLLYRPEKTIRLYIYMAMGKALSLLGTVFSQAACWAQVHTILLYVISRLSSVRKPDKLLVLVGSLWFVPGTLRREIDTVYISHMCRGGGDSTRTQLFLWRISLPQARVKGTDPEGFSEELADAIDWIWCDKERALISGTGGKWQQGGSRTEGQ